MENIVSFKTAKRLQAVGFPRPERIEPGQAWYDEHRKARWINSTKDTGYFPDKSWVYAPGLEEIMIQIPSYEVNFMGSKWEVCATHDTFYHEKGSEAAALGYFHYQKEEATLKQVLDYRKLERDQKADQN